jgi:hypothetical protein
LKIPKWSNIDGRSKIYWNILSSEFEKAGTLTDATLPEFIKLCKNLARRDQVDDFLQNENMSFLQETKFVDATGMEHSAFRESAYSKLSRDLDRIISQQLKSFRPKPKENSGKQKKDGFFED